MKLSTEKYGIIHKDNKSPSTEQYNNTMNNETKQQGALVLAEAIEQAREFMFNTSWVTSSPDPLQEKAAAERQLKNQIAAALDQAFIMHDPLYPELRGFDQHNQFGLFNPDNRYHMATISTPGTYVIRGKRGTSADLQIQVGSGEPGFTPGVVNIKQISQLSLPELETNDDGSFEIFISDKRRGQNWLNNTEGEQKATRILIRESFMDWQEERAGTWYIERVDKRAAPSPLTTPDLINSQYEAAAKFLLQSTINWVERVQLIESNTEPNTIKMPDDGGKGTLEGQISSIGIFPIEKSQAAIITLKKSPARYQSMQLGDLWFNSGDYSRRQTSLNMSQAVPSSDGFYRLVISHEDPGVANWLDPAGVSTIFAFLRWQGLPCKHEFSEDEKPKVKIVEFDKLKKCLPTDEPCFTKKQRAEQLATRQASALQSPRGF
ncbi:MAG: DUF1214 domain-containing protein [Akkermansiaceae bacterium]